MKSYRKLVTLLAICAALVAQETTPTFRTSTTLVEFTLVARDARGEAVTDLRQDEIQVTENRLAREVAYFRFEGAPETHLQEPAPPGIFTNRPEFAPGPPRNVIAVVLDAINSPLDAQAAMRIQVLRYLDALPPNTKAAVYRLGNHLSVIHDFTGDVTSLRRRLAGNEALELTPQFAAAGIMPADPPRSRRPGSAQVSASKAQQAADEGKALEIHNAGIRDERLAMTLSGLEAIGDRLAAISARKSLVWVGPGMPLQATAAGWPRSYVSQVQRTAQRLATLGISVYPVAALRHESGLELFAEITGGRVVTVMNDPTAGVAAAAADTSGSYTIGFYREEEADSGWRRIEVKVKRPGVKVRYRQGYVTGPTGGQQPAAWSEENWRAAIANPLGSTAVRMDARCEPIPAEPGIYGISLQIVSDDLQFQRAAARLETNLELVIADKVESRGSVFRVTQVKLSLPEVSQTGSVVRYTHKWRLQPDTSAIRVIARDRATGRYGTLDIPVIEK